MKTEGREPEPVLVKTIVSREGESFVGKAELMKGEEVEVGDYIVAELVVKPRPTVDDRAGRFGAVRLFLFHICY